MIDHILICFCVLVVRKQNLVKVLCTVKVDYIVCFCMFLQSSSAKTKWCLWCDDLTWFDHLNLSLFQLKPPWNQLVLTCQDWNPVKIAIWKKSFLGTLESDRHGVSLPVYSYLRSNRNLQEKAFNTKHTKLCESLCPANWDLFIWKYSMLAVGRIQDFPLPRSKISAGSANWALAALHLCRYGPLPAARRDVVLRSRLLQHMERPRRLQLWWVPRITNQQKSTEKDFQLNFPHVFWFRSVDDWMFQHIDSTFCFRNRKIPDPVKLRKRYPEGAR